MITEALIAMLKADPRNSSELSKASGIHSVAIRKMRTGVKPVAGVTLATAEQLAKALGATLWLDVPKKTKKKS